MDDQAHGKAVDRQHFLCQYCHGMLPEEPEEIRRVFGCVGMQPVIWIAYRCVNVSCQKKNFVLYTPLYSDQKA
jgi:hypothetical protein